MRKLIVIFTLFLAVSCSTVKYVPVIAYRDSVRVEYRDRVVVDTVAFYVPEIVEKNVTRDTSSHLENKYAKSDAVIADGLLSHSLETIPQAIIQPVQIHVTDTLYFEKEAQVVTETVEVPAELSWWQKFRMDAFWWLLGGLALAFLWIFRKRIF